MRKISLLSKVKKIIIDVTCKSVHSKINKKMMDLLNQTFCSCVYGVKAKKRYILCFAKNTAASCGNGVLIGTIVWVPLTALVYPAYFIFIGTLFSSLF